MRLLVRKRRWWYVACNPDETLATCEMPTYIRSRSYEGLVAKAQRNWGKREPIWTEVQIGGDR